MTEQRDEKFRRFWLVTTGTTLIVISLFLVIRNARRDEVRAPEEVQQQLPKRQEADITGGLPSHRREIDDYIRRVSIEDESTLIDNLNQHENILMRANLWSNDPDLELSFQVCLANRRVTKLYELLSKKGRDEAKGLSEQIYAQKISILKEGVTRGLDEWEANGKVRQPIPMGDNFMAACGATFLLAAFAPTKTVLEAVDQWEQFGQSAMERQSANPKLAILQSEITSFSRPERLFLLNLYLWHLIERCGATSAVEVLRDMSPRPLRIDAIPYIGWDGHTNAFDFTHLYSGVPVDRSRLLRTFEACPSWYSGTLYTLEQRDEVLRKVRNKLEACVAR